MNTNSSATRSRSESEKALLALMKELTRMLGELLKSTGEGSGEISKPTEGRRRRPARLIESDDHHERFSNTHTTEYNLKLFSDRLR